MGHRTLVHSRDRFWWFLYQYKPNNLLRTMAYSWDNRVKFVVRYMYDIDNNGFLDKNDFECLAVRNTVIEGKGDWDEATFKKNQEVMANLWNEIAELADFNKDGEISTDEFKKGSILLVKAKTMAIFHLHSNFSLRTNSERLTLMVTVPLDSQNSELTA